ncbi:uncharacterized protein TRAVEDRAFT_130820 [Trametes versicolor FP-101664 SS1]|uniref:uncharacterized protein n=1 Tax=Trametes versicolor (strain FP-101664) TaxID=717944 RepID=UPI0004623549|nr:uncharacterized protein TRAVEDRAFT_130820 [Trametes versicolor FP-101664 SS1]EIW55324.1 hypothetical protein TRAVEDRAFT_130820 [Trametes versicolor FP-101664 SS1]
MAPRPWTRAGPLLAAAVPYAALAAAYSFNIKNTPRQCEDLELDITGTGSPPYSALIIPTGPTPLANLVEARKITNVAFNGTNTTATFQLKFPENSQFVVVVSDSTGFGTGGTSAIATTLSGVDGCFDNTTSVQPAFLFHTQPDGILLTCSASRIWWLPGDVQGDTSFQGVIPGGESFQIPVGTLTNVTGTGTGFDWTPAIRSGTNLLLVGGDSRGLGSAGSNAYTLQSGSSVSCVNSTSPSSTPGSPAGGSYPTSTDGSGINTGSSSSNSKTNVGAIVGGVIGGVVGAIALGLVLLFAVRRQRFHNKGTKERPVDLLQDQDNEGAAGDGRPPEYYRPEPFLLPDPTVASTVHDDAGRPSADHRQSYLSQSSTSETGGAAGVLRPPPSTAPSSNTRKSAAPPTFRPVNIIQHDDAGPSEPPPPPAEEPETIELPPAYTNIRRNEIPSPKDEDDEATGGAGATGATTQVPQAAA